MHSPDPQLSVWPPPLPDMPQAPRRAMLSGLLDVVEYTAKRAQLLIPEGIVFVMLHNVRPADAAVFLGQNITLDGDAMFDRDGKLSVFVANNLRPAVPGDAMFTHPPSNESVPQQIERQLAEGKGLVGIDDFTGKWPGDESLEELLAMLAK